jgi:hypothetical protein
MVMIMHISTLHGRLLPCNMLMAITLNDRRGIPSPNGNDPRLVTTLAIPTLVRGKIFLKKKKNIYFVALGVQLAISVSFW